MPSLDEAPEPTEEEVALRRREFAVLLEAFRDTAVLVPLHDGGWLTADFGGIRWIHGVVFLDGQSGTLAILEKNVSSVGHIPYRNGSS
ncbi:hypothetical protein ACFWMJ_12850 [Streptomyces hawaiiensis]|uniref:hypothetical protein n=1 Tax=Streptomyces hawaiiensis TaxID=67305 RepID=UPI0036654152